MTLNPKQLYRFNEHRIRGEIAVEELRTEAHGTFHTLVHIPIGRKKLKDLHGDVLWA